MYKPIGANIISDSVQKLSIRDYKGEITDDIVGKKNYKFTNFTIELSQI